jgi:hypothetical protein
MTDDLPCFRVLDHHVGGTVGPCGTWWTTACIVCDARLGPRRAGRQQRGGEGWKKAEAAQQTALERRQLFLQLNDNYSCRGGAGWMERHGDQRAFRMRLG